MVLKRVNGLYVLMMAFLIPHIFAAAPITCQGNIELPGGGIPADGTYNIRISLWNVESGGAESANRKWVETLIGGNGVKIRAGSYSIQLGTQTLLNSKLFEDNPSLWLQIQVDLSRNGFGADDYLSPRVLFTGTSTAFYADKSRMAEDAERLIGNFTVAPGQKISAGDIVSLVTGNQQIAPGYNMVNNGQSFTFSQKQSNNISAAALTDSQIVIAYSDSSQFNHGKAIVGTISETNIKWGSPSVFNNAITENISVLRLYDDQFLVVYRDRGNNYRGTGIVGKVSGSEPSIAWGAEKVFNTGNTTNISATELRGRGFIVTYTDVSHQSYGTAIKGHLQVNSLELIFQDESVFNEGSTSHISTVELSSYNGRFLVSYRDNDDNRYGKVIVGKPNQSTISWGPESAFNNEVLKYASAVALKNNRFFVAYCNDGNDKKGMIQMGYLSNNDSISISWNDAFAFHNSPITNLYARSMRSRSPERFVVTFSDRLSPTLQSQRAVEGRDFGTSITLGNESIIYSSGDWHISTAFTEWRLLLTQSSGKKVMLCNLSLPLGIADADAKAGETIPVIINGVSDHHKDLVEGATYYGMDNGLLNIVPYGNRIGMGISSTKLLLDIER